jgi:hypothetical protein
VSDYTTTYSESVSGTEIRLGQVCLWKGRMEPESSVEDRDAEDEVYCIEASGSCWLWPVLYEMEDDK